MAAVLHGSMTLREILWDLPVAFGRQCEVIWWLNNGIEVVKLRR